MEIHGALIIYSPYGYRDLSWVDVVSNLHYEKSISSLIAKFRSYSETTPEDELPLTIHAQHMPIWVKSPIILRENRALRRKR
jgi:hypothetical protein